MYMCSLHLHMFYVQLNHTLQATTGMMRSTQHHILHLAAICFTHINYRLINLCSDSPHLPDTDDEIIKIFSHVSCYAEFPYPLLESTTT